MAGKFHSDEYVRGFVESLGFNMKSPYVSSLTPMDLECPKGHECHPTWNSFLQKKGCCNQCGKESRSKKHTQYPVNLDFFRNWSSDLAWVMGLIWSDGNLMPSINRLSITSKDHDLLLIVEKLAGAHIQLPDRNKTTYTWVCKSIDLMPIMKTHGLVARKSLIAKYPDIPTEFEADFIRGLIDGDGWVHLQKKNMVHPRLTVGLCGAASDMLAGVEYWCRNHGIRYNVCWQTKGHYHPVFRLTVSARDSLQKLCGLLYRDNCPCLKRKKDNYNEWINMPQYRARCKSGYKGVRQTKNGLRWQASICNKSIGVFDTAKEAALAYNEAAVFKYGDKTYLNLVCND